MFLSEIIEEKFVSGHLTLSTSQLNKNGRFLRSVKHKKEAELTPLNICIQAMLNTLESDIVMCKRQQYL